MKNGILSLFASTCVAAAMILAATPAQAQGGGPFVYTVSGVPRGDILNVRRWPRPNAPVVGKLRNGAQGYMTFGDCWNSSTGKRIPESKVDPQKPHTWCSISFGRDGQKFGYARASFLQ